MSLSTVAEPQTQTAQAQPASLQQPRVVDTGLPALALIANFHRLGCDVAQVRHEMGLGDKVCDSLDVVRASKLVKLKARRLQKQSTKALEKAPLPALVEMKDGQFLIYGRRHEDGKMRLVNAVTREVRNLTADELAAEWTGTLLLFARRVALKAEAGHFSIAWFLPFLWRYRRPLASVVTASLFIQLCTLATPLLFQIVIDKVLTHKGMSTLYMVILGMVLVGLFQALLTWLRTYMLTHTTSRIDVELGAKLFDHMVRLPLAYFEARATGQTVARMREIEQVRNFLTGSALLTGLDVIFSVVLVAVMVAYSPFLSVIALLSIPVYVVIGMTMRPLLRARMMDKFNKNALSTQFLVESVVGIQTVKAMAIEPVLRSEWEDRLAAYVGSSFDAVSIANVGQNAFQYVSKLSSAAVLFFGAQAVIDGDLTVGGLIAFNMIFGQVTGPILRISQLWQDFQQVQISVERLGDIMNNAPESTSMAQAHLPPAKGDVQIRGMTFRYEAGGREILKNINLAIPAGQVIGIVGPSGSGKSTLTKLVQRLYTPERGQILVDGIDVGQVDPAWLRRQVGVVLQENLLFNKTVHENIALVNPAMSRAQVIAMARLSGADEFINRLPLGYDTMIVERGANLSGGQRQRLAIARALASNPRILILDEATSALDYESERIIQENMRHIVHGRTVIIIAHRLAAVRDCHRIIAVQDGNIVEDGSHHELLALPTSLYGRLWRIQAGEAEAA
ncbi:type I secretion system permease/ATPase [Lichenibacterium dinghuense]|uniref:type I secretion system permease/ATPase n=1 Tax=Lichenibacterium dinghuense TaxID=2895977 RepID=UPI001F00AD49|nr:type I secretion system permease/ATPase [Lichenibacterium sp. 6Y81]